MSNYHLSKEFLKQLPEEIHKDIYKYIYQQCLDSIKKFVIEGTRNRDNNSVRIRCKMCNSHEYIPCYWEKNIYPTNIEQLLKDFYIENEKCNLCKKEKTIFSDPYCSKCHSYYLPRNPDICYKHRFINDEADREFDQLYDQLYHKLRLEFYEKGLMV